MCAEVQIYDVDSTRCCRRKVLDFLHLSAHKGPLLCPHQLSSLLSFPTHTTQSHWLFRYWRHGAVPLCPQLAYPEFHCLAKQCLNKMIKHLAPSLLIQQLRLHSHCRRTRFFTGQRTTSHMLSLRVCMSQLKKTTSRDCNYLLFLVWVLIVKTDKQLLLLKKKKKKDKPTSCS